MRTRSVLFLAATVILTCFAMPILTYATDNQDVWTVGEFTQRQVVPDFLTTSRLYQTFFDSGHFGPIVPGLDQGLVQQGLAYYPARNWMIISSYRTMSRPSTLSIIDMSTGRLVKTLHLYDLPGFPYRGHAGGIAVSEKHLWLGGENLVRGVTLQALEEAEDGARLVFSTRFRPETKATTIAYGEGILWVGEFYDPSEKPNRITDRHVLQTRDGLVHNAWAAGYVLDEQTDRVRAGTPTDDERLVPDVILSIPNQIQGMAFSSDIMLFSQSMGRHNDSRLLVFPNVMNEPPQTTVELGGKEVPVWLLDGESRVTAMIMPPLSEGLALYDGYVAIVFESAAEPYRATAKHVMDRLYLVELESLWAP